MRIFHRRSGDLRGASIPLPAPGKKRGYGRREAKKNEVKRPHLFHRFGVRVPLLPLFHYLILQGFPPYQLAYNMKFPGTYYAYSLILAAFGQTAWGIPSSSWRSWRTA